VSIDADIDVNVLALVLVLILVLALAVIQSMVEVSTTRIYSVLHCPTVPYRRIACLTHKEEGGRQESSE
jgi:hypothetical protein